MEFSEKISVVMPVYNTDVSILQEAVGSILGQTFQDFEFIIVDDCSSSPARDYLQALPDPRVRLLRNETNQGVTKSLNRGFRAAKGKYIARMDADDISLPQRLEKQYAFMESHPDAIVCGANVEVFGTRQKKPASVPGFDQSDMDAYRVKMLFVNPGPVHPTAFFSNEKLLRQHILYDEALTYAQDYGLWAEVSRYGTVWKLGEVLLRYRAHGKQISSAHRQRQIQCDQATQRKLLTELVGEVSDGELNLHYAWSALRDPDLAISPAIDRWYQRMLAANRKKRLYDQKKLQLYILNLKRQLIDQTCLKDPSFFKKAGLYFRYLPILPAVRASAKAMFLSFRR